MGKHLSSHSALSELAARLKAYRIDFPLEEGTQYVSFEYDKVTYVRGILRVTIEKGLFFVYGSYILYSALHFGTDMQRLQTLTFIPETEKNIVVEFVLNERKTNNIMLITVRRKVFIRAIIEYPVHDRFMNANFDFCLHCFQNVRKIQLRFLIIPRRERLLLYLQV